MLEIINDFVKKILKLWKNKLAFELASQEYLEFGHYLKYLAEQLRHSEPSTNLLKVSPFSAQEDPASPLEANCITCISYLAALHINAMSERQYPTLTVQCFQEARGKQRNSTRKNTQPLNSV